MLYLIFLYQQGYMSGGGGYVLSKEAVRRFVDEGLSIKNQSLCPNKDETGAEDLNLGIVLLLEK